jgi:hypothetical protein
VADNESSSGAVGAPAGIGFPPPGPFPCAGDHNRPLACPSSGRAIRRPRSRRHHGGPSRRSPVRISASPPARAAEDRERPGGCAARRPYPCT